MVCATNMSNMGKVAFLVAADTGTIPSGLKVYAGATDSNPPNKSMSYWAAVTAFNDIPSDFGNGLWKFTGLPLDSWVDYGMDQDLNQFLCPSDRWLFDFYRTAGTWGVEMTRKGEEVLPRNHNRADPAMASFSANNGWRAHVYSSYSWVGGYDSHRLGEPGKGVMMNPDFQRPRPLVSTTDSASASRVLCSDSVTYDGWSKDNWGTDPYEINHKSRVPGEAQQQNVLYGDGSVKKNGGSNIYGEIGPQGRGSTPTWAARGGEVYYYW